MIVTEIKNAVIDTVEFIIPPFIKLIIALAVASYVTSGELTKYLAESLSENLKSINTSNLKAIIDSFYLSSVVPILVIFLIILFAYSTNRILSFIGSLVPITYCSTTAIRNFYYIKELWKYFPTIESAHELRLKVTQLLSIAKASSLSLPIEQIKWQEENKVKKFSALNYINFLLLWSIASYFIVHQYLNSLLPAYRLIVTIFVLILIIIIRYFQIVQNELDIESTELMLVDNFLRLTPEYKKTEDSEELDKIERLVRLEQYYNKKWWFLSIGYRLDWIKMYKHYRPPFYWIYIKWRDRKKIVRKRTKSD
ncbi:MAG: hypothetical protein JSS79_05520 [Bacteroidetes bacterium]|nr:hypothetical protein [Bacteroidota bacterium]